MKGQAKLSQGLSLSRSRQGMPPNYTFLLCLIVDYSLIEPVRMTAKEDSETSVLRKSESDFRRKYLSNIKHNKEKCKTNSVHYICLCWQKIIFLIIIYLKIMCYIKN